MALREKLFESWKVVLCRIMLKSKTCFDPLIQNMGTGIGKTPSSADAKVDLIQEFFLRIKAEMSVTTNTLEIDAIDESG